MSVNYDINFDILSVLNLAKQLGWKSLKEHTISRVLYFSSVLYSFRYAGKQNPFDEYIFSVDSSGPFYSQITNSLIFLENNQYVKRSAEGFLSLGETTQPKPTKSEINLKAEWINHVLFILGLYGEGKIYEFVIRDPEYQKSLEVNSVKKLNTSTTNYTIKFLKEFKSTFEETLGKDSVKIDDKKYLQLYFEYVFSKVVKGKI